MLVKGCKHASGDNLGHAPAPSPLLTHNLLMADVVVTLVVTFVVTVVTVGILEPLGTAWTVLCPWACSLESSWCLALWWKVAGWSK